MDEQLTKNILKNMPLGYALHKFVKDENDIPCDYIFLDINSRFEEYVGVCASDIIGKKVTEVMMNIMKDNFDWIKTYAKVAYGGGKIQLEQYVHSLKRWYRVNAYSPQKGYFVTLVDDISEKKELKKKMLEVQQVTKKQETIIDIYKQEFSDQKEFMDHTLRCALKMSGSQNGYIFLCDEKKKEFELYLWNNNLTHNCKTTDEQINYLLEKTGICGDVVRERKPIIINDSQKFNLSKDGSQGHVQLLNYMSCPVFIDGKIVAVVCLGNRKDYYTEFEVNQLTVLMQGAWLIKEAKENSLKQNNEQIKYNNILNKIPVLVCEFTKDGTLTYVNDEYCKYFGYERENLIDKLFLNLIPEEEHEAVMGRYSSLTPENPVSVDTHHVLKGNETCLMEWQNVATFDEHEMITNYYSIGSDVTEREELEKQDKNELAILRSVVENNSAVILFVEPETGKILDANPAASDFYGYTKSELLNMSSKDINIFGEEKVRELRLKALKKEQKCYTYPHKLKSGEIRIVDVHSSPINFNSKQVLLTIIFDVTDKEGATEQIRHLAYHDYLTGAYNRRYFEEIFARLNTDKNYPLAVIMGDINGLKIVNDSLGHGVGDKLIKETVKLIKSTIRGNDILARVGGDEFAILLTKTSKEDVLRLTSRLEDELERYVDLVTDEKVKVYLSVSFGYEIQNEDVHSLDELMRESDSHVYRRKYYNKNSVRSNMIKSLMSTLFQKSEREEKHSQRVSKYCEALAKVLNFDLKYINKISVAGSLHDIGKIGISETILNKEGKLDSTEWEIMRLHPIKSAEILLKTEEYKDIADVVAAHHERWDGTGYPNGLKGEDIPIMARLIAVTDAYDAMVSLRSYRKPMSKEEAITELIKCSGTQFDPRIADVFVNQVLMKDDINENNDL